MARVDPIGRLAASAVKRRPFAVQVGAVVIGGAFFLVLLPLLLGLALDPLARLVPVSCPRWGELAAAGVFVPLGLFVMLWSVFAIWHVGKGTPVPTVATQLLVVKPPYSYCRNPMKLGTTLFYFGIGCAWLSLWAGLLMFFAALCVGSAYHRLVEEKELALRFGAPYEAYRRSTPFLIPRFRARKRR